MSNCVGYILECWSIVTGGDWHESSVVEGVATGRVVGGGWRGGGKDKVSLGGDSCVRRTSRILPSEKRTGIGGTESGE